MIEIKVDNFSENELSVKMQDNGYIYDIYPDFSMFMNIQNHYSTYSDMNDDNSTTLHIASNDTVIIPTMLHFHLPDGYTIIWTVNEKLAEEGLAININYGKFVSYENGNLGIVAYNTSRSPIQVSSNEPIVSISVIKQEQIKLLKNENSES